VHFHYIGCAFTPEWLIYAPSYDAYESFLSLECGSRYCSTMQTLVPTLSRKYMCYHAQNSFSPPSSADTPARPAVIRGLCMLLRISCDTKTMSADAGQNQYRRLHETSTFDEIPIFKLLFQDVDNALTTTSSQAPLSKPGQASTSFWRHDRNSTWIHLYQHRRSPCDRPNIQRVVDTKRSL
jgi:hypothetical protein